MSDSPDTDKANVEEPTKDQTEKKQSTLVSDKEKSPVKRRAGNKLGITPSQARERNIRAKQLKELEESGRIVKEKPEVSGSGYRLLAILTVIAVIVGALSYYSLSSEPRTETKAEIKAEPKAEVKAEPSIVTDARVRVPTEEKCPDDRL